MKLLSLLFILICLTSTASSQTLGKMDPKLQKELLDVMLEGRLTQYEIVKIFEDATLMNKRYLAYRDKDQLLSRSSHPLDRAVRETLLIEGVRLGLELKTLQKRNSELQKRLSSVNQRLLKLKERLGSKAV
jgi:hypothetical protein